MTGKTFTDTEKKKKTKKFHPFTDWDCHTDNPVIIANEQAERRLEACEAATLMPREVGQLTEKFSIVCCEKCNVSLRSEM